MDPRQAVQVDAPFAVAEIAIISVYFVLPFAPGLNPQRRLRLESVNYAPILTVGSWCWRVVGGPVGEVVQGPEDDDRPPTTSQAGVISD